MAGNAPKITIHKLATGGYTGHSIGEGFALAVVEIGGGPVYDWQHDLEFLRRMAGYMTGQVTAAECAIICDRLEDHIRTLEEIREAQEESVREDWVDAT
jgi:hypothetical protein